MMIKNTSVLIIFLLLFGYSSNLYSYSQDSGSQEFSKTGTLRIGYDDRPPSGYTDEDGNPKGYDIEYLSKILDAANIDYQFYRYPWKRIVRHIENGQLDIAMAAAKLEERQEFAFFSDEIFKLSSNILFIHKNYTEQFEPFDALSELSSIPAQIGVMRGTSYSDEYQLLLPDPNFGKKLVALNDVRQALNLAITGRIAGFIATKEVGLYELALRCQSHNFVEAYDLLKNESTASFLMFSKKTISRDLVNKIDQVMKTLKRRNENLINLDTNCVS